MNLRRESNSPKKIGEKQSWRKNSGAKPTSKKLWSSKKSAPEVGTSRSVKLFIAIVLLLASTGGVIQFLLRFDLKPSMLVMAVDHYEYPWSPNGWAKEDADWLKKRLQVHAENMDVLVAKEIPKEKSIDEWIQFQLDSPDFKSGGPGGGTIWRLYSTAIIYLSAHLVLERNDQPCLLIPSAMGDDAWAKVSPVPLEKVLQAISNHPKLKSGQLRGIRKLVVLDIGKQPPNLALGIVQNDLHSSIQKVVESQTDRHLAVLVACGEHQRAWTAPELGGSNFGIWFANGLAGAADKDRGGRVTLRELCDYLSVEVDRFAKAHRAAEQMPICFFPTGKPIDFDLTFSKSFDRNQSPKGTEANSVDRQSGDEVGKQWQDFEKWKATKLAYDPGLVSEAHGRLVRADQLLLAGPSHRQRLDDEIVKITELLTTPSPTWPLDVAGQSKAVQIDAEWDRISDENKKLILNWLDDVQIEGKKIEKAPAIAIDQASVGAWQWLMKNQDQLSIEHIDRVRLLLQEGLSDATRSLPPRDVVLFRSLIDRFHALKDNPALGDPSQISGRLKALVDILKAHRALEKAFGIQDPRLANWLTKQMPLQQKFLLANDYWFVGSSATLDTCNQYLNPLNGDLVSGIPSSLDQAATERESLESAWILHDDLAMQLPRMTWAIDHHHLLTREKGKEIRANLDRLSVDLKELNSELAKDPATAKLPSIDDLKRRWDAVSRQLSSLFATLGREKEFDAETCRSVMLWFEQPVFLNGVNRSALRERLISHLGKKLELNVELEILPLLDTTPAELESWEKNLSRNLLDGILPSDWLLDDKSPSLSNRYLQLHRSLWDGIQEQLKSNDRTANVNEASVMNDSYRQAWQARLAAPWLPMNPSSITVAKKPSPTRIHWSKSAQIASVKMAEFAIEDFWLLPSDDRLDDRNQSRPYFVSIAQNWLDAARARQLSEGNLSESIIQNRIKSIEDSSKASRDWRDDFWNGLPMEVLPAEQKSVKVIQPKKNLPDGVASLLPSVFAAPEPVGSKESVTVDVVRGKSTSASIELKASFRGRSTDRQLQIKQPNAEMEIVWSVKELKSTRVMISSDDEPHQILFVLDCSNSFTPMEHVKAKEAILNIISRLPVETEVGLIAFGHSAYWIYADRPDVQLNLNVQHLIEKKAWDNRTPENDVDLIIPFQTRDEQTISTFKEKMDLLQPFGYTPLYNAMKISLDYAQKESRVAKPNIVVITDGINNVTTNDKGTYQGPLNNSISYASLHREIDGTRYRLRLDVIAYQFKDLEKQYELKEKVVGNKNFYVATDQEGALSEVVRQILGLRSFSIRVEGKKRPSKDFGTSDYVPTGKSTKLEIVIDDTNAKFPVMAMGGEFLDAKFDAERKQLRYAPLNLEPYKSYKLKIDETPWQISTLRGDRIGTTRYLRVAIQATNETQPSIRPRRLWVELQVKHEGVEQTLGISDVEWEADRLAPVFRIPILNGTPEKVRIWLCFDESKRPPAIPYSKWETRGGSRQFPNVKIEPGETEGHRWSLGFSQPIDSRLSWSLDPAPSFRIEYKIGPTQYQKYWYKDQQEEDVGISIEVMPLDVLPDKDKQGWHMTDWLDVPKG